MVATALTPLGTTIMTDIDAPSWINSYVRLLILSDFIKGDRELTEDLTTEL